MGPAQLASAEASRKRSGNPDRVDPASAERAYQRATGRTEPARRQAAWTEYILCHFEATGQMAPGCDMRDLMAWYGLTQ